MRNMLITIAAVALSTNAIAAAMRPAAAPVPQASDTPDMSCASFTHNQDGSWTPIRDLSMAGIAMPKGKPIKPGVQAGGIDIVTHLDDECAASMT